MAQRTKINTGNTQGGVFKCICGLRYDDAAEVHVFALSDPNNLFKGITFDPNGNHNEVMEWNFTWDDTSVVAAVMEEGTVWVNNNGGVKAGSSTSLLSVKYISNRLEEVPVASVCYIDDSYTPDAMIWAAVTDFDGGTYHTPNEFDWIEITLIVPSALIPINV
jgi:hypothetical protein